VDQPNAATPQFRTYTTETGLSSNEISSLVEDTHGYIYVGTGRGLNRVDPSSDPATAGSVKRFTAADGFPRGEIRAAYRDRNGTLWFASRQVVAQLSPDSRLMGSSATSPVGITGVRVNGLPQNPIPELKLEPDMRQLEIQFSGIDYSTDRQLLYQYKLEGADKNWNAPTTERRVTYANLAPGHYRFMVRAGAAAPAAIDFTLESYVWQRWWFRTLALLGLASVARAIYRFRVSRLLAIERLRTQIATDLHDDIGSSLSQISILSELASCHVNSHDRTVLSPLSRIGEISRELADSMNDIVWAINPRHDYLADLVYRMRRFADETLSGSNVRFELTLKGSSAITLNASQRRDLFLIFKEIIHNAIRHSGCTEVHVEIGADGSQLSLNVTDNGRGFDPEDNARISGAGLDSIRRRSARLGSKVTINSEIDSGTSIHIRTPLPKQKHLRV